MKTKVIAFMGPLFGAAIGYSVHSVSPEPAKSFPLTLGDPALERFGSHLDHAHSIYAMLFKSHYREGDRTEIAFRRTLEELTTCEREMQEDPNRRYFDFRIVRATSVPGPNNESLLTAR
jgi:hypothetical protein